MSSATPVPTPRLFPFEPDGGAAITETWRYLTNIITSQSDYEQRIALRSAPAMTLGWQVSAFDLGESSHLSARLWENTPNYWLVPLWPSRRKTTVIAAGVYSAPMANTLFALSGTALVWRTPILCDVMTVTAISGTGITLAGVTSFVHAAGDWIVPLRNGTMQSSFTKTNFARVATLPVEFELDLINTASVTPLAPIQLYRGVEVMSQHPSDEKGETPEAWAITSQEQGTIIGKRWREALAPTPVLSRPVQWVLLGWDEITTFRQWLAVRRGRRNPCWIPTYQDDLLLAAPIIAGATDISIVECSFATRYLPFAARQDICVLKHPDVVMPARVTGVSITTPGVEVLHLSAPIPTAMTQNARVSFLTYARLSSDDIAIAYQGIDIAVVDTTLIEVPREVPA